MATISAKIVDGFEKTRMVTWEALTKNGGTLDIGAGVSLGQHSDKTIQAVGTFGAGPGAIHVSGSNDGTNWARLHDAQGVVIALTAAAPIAIILEHPLYIRAEVGVGETDVTDVDVFMNVALKV